MEHCNLSRAVSEIRDRAVERVGKDPTRYIAAWSEKERLDGEPCKAFVLILRTGGCRWYKASGCTFCGYINDTTEGVGMKELSIQFERALERYDGQEFFKIYTSGSFLDPEEVPSDFSEKVVEELSERGIKRLLIETLPRFANDERLKRLMDVFKGDGGIEFALGLESATPKVLKYSINKPARVEDFEDAARRIHENGGRVRTYIIIKPPLLTEKGALEDALGSAMAVKDWTDTISFNPINVQRGTVVERLWKRREYQPPWLWTVVEVLGRSAKLGPRIISAPTGGGTRRGAHNCGKCDRAVLSVIERYSNSSDPNDLVGPSCGCLDDWKDQLELEEHIHGPFYQDRKR